MITADKLLDFPLFKIGQTQATVGSLLAVTVVLITTFVLARIASKVITDYYQRLTSKNDKAIALYGTVVKVIVWFIGLELALHILGIHLTALFAAGGFFALGTGFAVKNVVENFISGTIIRTEKTIQTGDLIIVGDRWLTVKHLGVRTIEATTSDGMDIIIPNSTVAQSTVENLTRRDHRYRIKINVGIAHDSDRVQVRKTLEESVNKLDWISKQKSPAVHLDEFGDSAIRYKIEVWIDEVKDSGRRRSDLHEAVWQALDDAGIIMAYPQLDVHLVRSESE